MSEPDLPIDDVWALLLENTRYRDALTAVLVTLDEYEHKPWTREAERAAVREIVNKALEEGKRQ
jgi:hypothetical protein